MCEMPAPRAKRTTTFAIFFLLASGASREPARADEAVQRARQLASSATTHYELGEFDEALRDWKEAFRAKREPHLLFNIAQCHRRLGHATEAAQFYRTYLRDVPDARDRELVVQTIGEMEAQAAKQAAERPGPEAAPPAPASLPPITQIDPLPPLPPRERPLFTSYDLPRPRRWWEDRAAMTMSVSSALLVAAGAVILGGGAAAGGQADAATTAGERSSLLSRAQAMTVSGGVVVGVGGALFVGALVKWLVTGRPTMTAGR